MDNSCEWHKVGSPPWCQDAVHDTSSSEFKRNLDFKNVQVIYFKLTEHF